MKKQLLSELNQQEMENYLNLREQYGLVVATKYKNSIIRLSELTPLFFSLAIADRAMKICNHLSVSRNNYKENIL